MTKFSSLIFAFLEKLINYPGTIKFRDAGPTTQILSDRPTNSQSLPTGYVHCIFLFHLGYINIQIILNLNTEYLQNGKVFLTFGDHKFQNESDLWPNRVLDNGRFGFRRKLSENGHFETFHFENYLYSGIIPSVDLPWWKSVHLIQIPLSNSQPDIRIEIELE